MSRNKRIIWSIGSIIVLGVLTNAIIIATAYIYIPNLFWLLLITMPLLIAGICNARQTNHILGKNHIIRLQAAKRQKRNEWPSHSIYPNKIEETDLKVLIGNDQCWQPYNACIFHIRSIKDIYPEKASVRAIMDKKFEHPRNSSEENLQIYSLGGGDLVWQIDPAYIGCRTANGNFNSKVFKENACRSEIKMIELMLSTSIQSVYAADSLLDIGDRINPKINNRIFLSSSYSTFRDAEGMMHFLDSLRELSGKKPIGIRLRINDKKEFREICHAIGKTQLIPDFIVVEGSFESTCAVHKGIHAAMPLYEALLFVSQTLQIYGLETKIKIIASGKIISCFDILRVLALGANAVCTEMPAYNTNDARTFSLYKGQNLNDFRNYLLKTTVHAMKVYGFMNVSDITLSKVFRKLDMLPLKGSENLNGPISYPGTANKVYTSKLKSYQSREERKGVQYRRL
jgi:glutamate synthase-like protein